jgi:predicted nucleic acid-binding protein
MATVCFDTDFLISAIHAPSHENADQILRAQYAIIDCQDRNDRILVPTLVLGELLVQIPEQAHDGFLRQMERDFILTPFDARSAAAFARMWRSRPQGLLAEGLTRIHLKADYLIAAVAVANGCRCIYSSDKGMKAFAFSHIPVLSTDDISLPPHQTDLGLE